MSLFVCLAAFATSGAAQDVPSPSFELVADHVAGDKLFGSSIGTYHRDGDGIPDIVVGIPSGSFGDGRVKIISGADGTTVLLDLSAVVSLERFGWSVAVLPDFTGDALPDLAVGAPGSRTVYLYNGLGFGTPILTLNEPSIANFGSVLASAGDVTGNGAPDLIVGVPSQTAPGAAYVYELPTLAPVHTITEGNIGDEIGASACSVGDLDGDSRDEFMIGAPGFDGADFNVGKATIFSGMTGNPLQLGGVTLVFEGLVAQDRLGESVAYLERGSDGAPRFLVGVPDYDVDLGDFRGAVFIYTTQNDRPRFILPSDSDAGRFAQRIVPMGDVDADNVDDFAVSSETYSLISPGGGGASVYSGATLARLLFVGGKETNSRLGTSMAAADFDGDMRNDLVCGQPRWGGGLPFPDDDRGRVVVWHSTLYSSAHFDQLCVGDGSVATCPCGNTSGSGSGQGCVHGGGVGMTLSASGSPSITTGTLDLTVGNAPAGEPGMFFASRGQGNPMWALDGLQCIDGPAIRFLNGQDVVSQDLTGIFYRPGTRVIFQYYSKDASSTCGNGGNLSAALSVVMSL